MQYKLGFSLIPLFFLQKTGHFSTYMYVPSTLQVQNLDIHVLLLFQQSQRSDCTEQL